MLPIDAAVRRAATRIGYGDGHLQFAKSARSVREAVARDLTRTVDSYRRAYLYLSHHSATTCTEGDPHCSVCPLKEDRPEGQQRLRGALEEARDA